VKYRRTLAATVLTSLALAYAAPARAEMSKAQCIAANVDAQSLRREGKLSLARQKLRACGDPACPALITTDCAKRLDELESVQPTLIFEVKDAAGGDLTEVRVTVDGQPLLQRLDGTATAVDPGSHRFVFSVPGAAPLTQQLVIREGERARVVSVVFESLGARQSTAMPSSPGMPATDDPATSAPAESSAAPDSSSNEAPRPRRTLGYVVAGVGVGGVVVGGVFGYLALMAKNRQIANCRSSADCKDYQAASDAHADARSRGTISSIAFPAGAAVAALGVVLIVTAKAAPSEKGAASLTLRAHAWPGDAGLGLAGAF
jgi:hypothetical protein